MRRPGVGGRLPRLYDESRYDPTCPGCANPDAGHRTHRTVADVVPELVAGGLPWTVASGKCGVVRFVTGEWMKRGAAEIQAMVDEDRDEPLEREAPYVSFTEAVLFAQADAQARLLANWQANAAAKKDWRGIAAYMSEVWPEAFGRRAEGTVIQVVAVDGALPPLRSLEEIEAELAERIARATRTGAIRETTGRELEAG